ncbi:hypothetical protein OE88DRAFT_1227633 [Heliocybe sulcata]|uniref:F-box domain-containing protein n=1 Tax=Heliocybe sulcata TaxID=5364 RepID=A0A5C3MV68_9AGAM|nr:hypothetical protein OE88DRAFT_1227633 [Heliocybe sulcata]
MGPPSSIDVAERLRRLRNYTKAWRGMAFSPSEEGIPFDGRYWELYGGVLATSVGDSTLIFNKLPSHARGIKSRQWRIEDVGFPIRDFKMDLSQDLLVILDFPEQVSSRGGGSCAIHLRTLSMNEPHSSAADTIIAVPVRSPYDPDYAFDIMICEDKVGIMFTHDPEDAPEDIDIFVYNWKIASLAIHIHGCNKPINTFTFLSPQHILLGILDPDYPRLEVYSLYQEANRDPEWTGQDYLCAFLYEKFYDYRASGSMKIQGDPAPSWAPLDDREVPFFTASESRVLCVSYTIEDDNGPEFRDVVHLIPLLSLLSLLPHSADEVGTSWLWKAWSERTTMHEDMVPEPTWCCYVHGARFVYVSTSEDPIADAQDMMPLTSFANVIDLNPVALRREYSRRGEEGLIHRSRTLSVLFWTNREFLYTTFPLPESRARVMISEDNLILVKSNGRRRSPSPSTAFDALHRSRKIVLSSGLTRCASPYLRHGHERSPSFHPMPRRVSNSLCTP